MTLIKALMSKKLIFVLLGLLSFHSLCCETRTHTLMTIIDPNEGVSDRRLLLESKAPHNLKIWGQYSKSTKSSEAFQSIRVMFGVAKAYYQRVLKVYPLQQIATKFRVNNSHQTGRFDFTNENPCNQYVNANFIRNGFDSNSTDMVVFVAVKDQPRDNTVARAFGCQFETRLIYGLIVYNTIAEDDFYDLPPFRFHQQIQTTLHQLTHLLGFSSEFYSLYSESPTAYKKIPQSKVIRKVNNRYYIVTPNVLKYVSTYFNCRDNQTGALLENQQKPENRTPGHWEQLVYRDQLMTPMNWLLGSKITKLTLALLKDTNFYAEVDDSLTDVVYYGSGRGCKFAQGDPLEFIKECKAQGPVVCDFYSMFRRQCSRTNYSDNIPVERFYVSCLYFGQDSRCFLSGANNIGSCNNASCSEDGRKITVTINNTAKICEYPGQSLAIGTAKIITWLINS